MNVGQTTLSLYSRPNHEAATISPSIILYQASLALMYTFHPGMAEGFPDKNAKNRIAKYKKNLLKL
jgi:hypothetical protein